MIKIYFYTMRNVKNIHLIGIGGSGMSGIAEVLLSKKYFISGSDINVNANIKRLKNLGAEIFHTHEKANVIGANVVVVSSAISQNNIELIEAKKKNIPILTRAEMLAELMRFHFGIAISGTHGKTTTTSIIAGILTAAGCDPTFVVGGLLKSINSNARLGSGSYFVAEADESDASFTSLNPMISVILNIDKDHMQTYGNNFLKLQEAFLLFLHKLPFYGVAVVFIDDKNVRKIIKKINRSVITYGFTKRANIQCINYKQIGCKTIFKVKYNIGACDEKFRIKLSEFELNLLGKHNVINALAAITVARELNINEEVIKNTLKKFPGVEKRIQIIGEVNFTKGVAIVIDDYGHHPKEIDVTLRAVKKAFLKKRLVLVFQPHRYTRTHDLFNDFVLILSKPDVLILLDIYAAGEKKIKNVTGKNLFNAIKNIKKKSIYFVENIDKLTELLDVIVHENDVLLLQGAGNIGNVSKILSEKFKIRDVAN